MVVSASAEREQAIGSIEGCWSPAASVKGDLAVACLRGCYPTAAAKWTLVAASVEGRCPAAAANARGDLAAACFEGCRGGPGRCQLQGLPLSCRSQCQGGPGSRLSWELLPSRQRPVEPSCLGALPSHRPFKGSPGSHNKLSQRAQRHRRPCRTETSRGPQREPRPQVQWRATVPPSDTPPPTLVRERRSKEREGGGVGCQEPPIRWGGTVGIWSVRHSGGPVLQGLNTRGCEVPGRTTHQLVISNHGEDKEELPAEVDCGIIANH